MISSWKRYIKRPAIAVISLALIIGFFNLTPRIIRTNGEGNSEKTFLTSLVESARQGRVINCSFSVKTTIIENVFEKWGKPESFDWIPEAKGNYAIYYRYGIVFGVNKGSQIYEIKSFDSRIKKLSFSEVKNALGTPAYAAKANGHQILGYLAGNEFKILFVFPEATAEKTDPSMIYYSVFYPRGTVNLMSEDPGREW